MIHTPKEKVISLSSTHGKTSLTTAVSPATDPLGAGAAAGNAEAAGG